MMKFRVLHSNAVSRVTEVLKAITASDEWRLHSPDLITSDWECAREPFRRFIDVYEGEDGQEWLGIMESAVVRELRSRGSDLTVDPTTVDRVVAWMSKHPNIEMLP